MSVYFQNFHLYVHALSVFRGSAPGANPQTEVFMMVGLIKRVISAALALCLILTASVAFAGSSVGSTASSITPSSAKVFIQLSKSVTIFSGDKYNSGKTAVVGAGTVLQLVSDNYYTANDGLAYYSLYYKSTRYNVLYSDVNGDIMSTAEVADYIENKIWSATSFTTLKQNTVGDIQVYALQKALRELGYYSGSLDGNYGTGTASAVKAFQKANGLYADGEAGAMTLPVIYKKVSGGSGSVIPDDDSSSTPTEESAVGTLITNVSVNMRKTASKSSVLLTVVPAKVSLPYSRTTVSSGTTWYHVTYNSRSGWLMGSFVTADGKPSDDSGNSSTTGSSGTLKTTSSVNFRQGTSTATAKLAVIPRAATLPYTNKTSVNGINWYRVEYNGMTGWLMGTFIQVISSSGPVDPTPQEDTIGRIQIIKASTHVRKTANGEKSGVVLAKGTYVDQLAEPVTAGSYQWYRIRTASGLVGYVRNDCAKVVSGGGGDTPIVDSGNTFAKLTRNVNLFTTKTKPTSGFITAPSGTVIKLVSPETYSVDGVTYCSVYYKNSTYNCVYSEVYGDIMSASALNAYVDSLHGMALPSTLKSGLNLKGNIWVYALQDALKTLGYYTATPSGNFDTTTETAIRNFQRSAGLSVDGACGTKTWAAIYKKLNNGGGGSGDTPTNFGTINQILKANWTSSDNGGSLIPKGTYATVLDITTGKVFSIYRWSGGTHADCVPATAADTKTMCDIVGFPYNSAHPTSAQLSKIKADGNASVVNYTWPDFKAKFGGSAKNIGSAWDRRPALLNVNGTVYCVSIYGFPHGYNGTDAFSKSKFPSGQYFYEVNNFYGMMCVHFVGSSTHSSSVPDSQHQANINKAYDYAKKNWPTLCK